jgi:hypothetical protein
MHGMFFQWVVAHIRERVSSSACFCIAPLLHDDKQIICRTIHELDVRNRIAIDENVFTAPGSRCPFPASREAIDVAIG